MGDLTLAIRGTLTSALPFFIGALVIATIYLGFTGSAGLVAFSLIATGAIIALRVWTANGIGVPLMPMIAVQQLAVNTVPILNNHEILTQYSQSQVTAAGVEVLVFLCALSFAWLMGLRLMRPAPPRAYALIGIDREGAGGLARMGFIFVSVATVYLVLQSLGYTHMLLSSLPSGSSSVIMAVVSAASACGFFLLAMLVGSRSVSMTARIAFWTLMATNCLLSASSLLLSSAAIVVFAVWIGLFWGTGRIPWRFTLITLVTISFFNTGKYAMRGRYWETTEEENRAAFDLFQLPSFYAEWGRASFQTFLANDNATEDVIAGRRAAPKATLGREQSLLDRLNNLQNILYVIHAVQEEDIPTLGGKTYAVIPPLLVPRILWPSKPRTHEGQVMLNVHFGRQLDVESTFKTYVAWGLLAEAYGNFGAIKGTLLLGLVLGLCFAWAENFTALKPLLSTEGFVAFIIFSGLANSYEMVSSVLVTAIFQSVIPVIAATFPFVRRTTITRPEPRPA